MHKLAQAIQIIGLLVILTLGVLIVTNTIDSDNRTIGVLLILAVMIIGGGTGLSNKHKK